MFEELKNLTIDTTKEEFKDFPTFLNGHVFIEYDNGFATIEPEHQIIVPKSITMRQARLYLLSLELLDDVELLVSQNKAQQIEWEYASEVQRTNQLIPALQESLGLTNAQVDTMFIEASKL